MFVRHFPVFLSMTLCLGVSTASAQTNIIHVPGDYPTIQAGIKAANDNDMVLVDPGVYNEAVQFGLKTVRLVSSAGPSNTVIVAPAGQAAVSFGTGTTRGLLSGFTISNSPAAVTIESGLASCGGCPTPTITSNIIINCANGIHSQVSVPTISYNHIIGCTNYGIAIAGPANAVIEGNIVERCGEGISLGAVAVVNVHNNIVRENLGVGIGLPSYFTSQVNLSQNVVVNNGYHGIYFPGGGRGPWIINNTIAGNGGAGIVKDGSAPDIRIINNVVVGNPALLVIHDETPSIVAFNDFYSRTGPAITGALTNLQDVISGNISADPFFACEPAEDYHLVAASPAIDVGTNGAPLLSTTDLDGGPRFLAGNTNDSSVVDMGAYEFDPSSPPTPCLFLICPTNMIVMAAPGQSSAAVSYLPPFATPGATVMTSPASGSLFPGGDNTVSVSAAYGTNVTNCTFTVTVITDHDLARALNATNLPWVSFGDTMWFAQNVTTHDGIAAAQSGPMTTNIQSSTLRTVLQGPGPLSFWWKLSTLQNLDFLYFIVDGVTQASFTGGLDWHSNVFNIPPGPHIVDWQFVRGEYWWGGQVEAWLDQVSYPPGPIPLILLCPTNEVVVAKPGQYSAAVTYAPPFATPGAVVTTVPSSGSMFPGGVSKVNVAATYGTNSTNCSFTVNVQTAHDLPPAVNTTNLDWITAGDASWYTQTNVTRDGLAAQSGAITNGQISTMQTTLLGPAEVTFWWKVSSETNHDLLFLTANGSTQAVISGEVNWQQRTIYLGAGMQVLQWSYAKDASGNGGLDTGWVDQVSWVPGSFPPSGTVQPPKVVTGIGSTATFSVITGGTPPLRYQWLFNGNVLPGATNAVLVVPNVDASKVGSYSVIVMNALGTVQSSSAALRLTEVIAWGANSYGQTNVPTDLTDVAAIAGGWHHSVALRNDGTVIAWGANNRRQTNVPASLSNVVAIASRSGDHAMALRVDGTVAVWGDNSYGQTNVPAGLSNVVAIAAGGYRCLALRSDGTAVSWGDSRVVPAGLSNLVAVSAGDYVSLFLRPDGSLVATGTTVPANVTNIIAIAAGGLHNLALRADGKVLAWGDNLYGQISVPTNLDQVIAIAAGDYHSTALRADGTVVNWGKYFTGQGYVTPVMPAGLTNVHAIAAGSDHDLALLIRTPPTPYIAGQPSNQIAVAGMSATLTVNAEPTASRLSYQWRFNGTNDIPGATSSSLTLSNVQSADVGLYSVRVTNLFGSIVSSNALLKVDHPPVADASATRSPVISANGTNATVVLDGSLSSDPDNDPLQYIWFSGLNSQSSSLLASGVVAVVTMPVGDDPVALVVSDGVAMNTNGFTLTVLTTGQAVTQLDSVVSQSGLAQSNPLSATLQAALASLARGNSIAAVNQLQAFQNKVSAQVAPSNPALARTLIAAAQQVINAVESGASSGAIRLVAAQRPASGKVQIRFSGGTGRTHIVEASTNLQDWELIGAAREENQGQFQFEDPNSAAIQSRFYRVRVP
jgi:hypothetical protein